MEVLYESSDLQAAFNAFAAAEQIAFQRSCDDVPRDDGGLTATYDCDVQINPSSLIDDFERTCVAAGGSVQDFGGTPVGIECCGTGTNNNGAGGGQLFLTYGYHTLDQRSCVAASTCTEQEASRFYPQGIFMEATNVFQEELGLVCGAGCGCGCVGGCNQCPPTATTDDCASETASYDTDNSELAMAKFMYYTAVAEAVNTCLQDQQTDSTNFDCGTITVDAAPIDFYREACVNVGGLLASSESVLIACSSLEYTLKLAFEGTLTCISRGCDLDTIATKDLISDNTQDSPAAAFDAIDTSMCENDTTDGVSFCHGYITGSDSFSFLREPQAIPCGTSRFGDAVFPSFQDSSCCSGDGRYFVESGQIGGFDAGYAGVMVEPACYAFAEALSMTLCDPRQGDFIDRNAVLRICQSSCDMVFDACGLPGVNFPEFTTYNDGTSLCYELFGGFGSSSPCDSRDEGYVCRSGLTIEVMIDDQNCLDIVVPTIFDEYGQSPDACANNDDNELSSGLIVGIAVGALVGCCFLLGCLTFACHQKRQQGKDASGTTTFVETPAVANEIPQQVTDHKHNHGNTDESPPMIHEVAYLEPSASEQPPSSASTTHMMEQVATSSTPARIPTFPSTNDTDTDKSEFSNPPAGNPAFIAPPLTAAVPPIKHVVSLAHVMDMTDSHDQVTAVKHWMAENPTDAAALTPQDTAKVLSQVTFSLNKASVAKELAIGIGRTGNLTCAHVVAAMMECSFQKKDVAECMAPHVNDPHNKNAVLSGIEFLSERTAVAKGFRG